MIAADEDGKVKQLPVNRRATGLWRLLNPDGLRGDFLVGDLVILGARKREDMTDVSGTLIALLLETPKYQVQVCLSRQFNSWISIGRIYDDFFEATISALSLMEGWEPPKNVNVVAVE